MAKHSIIWDDGVEDSIEVYNNEPVVVVRCERIDLDKLANIDEANVPGIYVLFKDNMRYVGQASSSVFKRIAMHDKNKDWWTEVVAIGRADKRLDKSQLDYLENYLINEFSKAGFDMDNANGGNSSHIESFQKGKAQQVLNTGIKVLEESAHIYLFKKARASSKFLADLNVPNQEPQPQISEKVGEKGDETVAVITCGEWVGYDRYAKRCYVKFIEYLVETQDEVPDRLVAISEKLGNNHFVHPDGWRDALPRKEVVPGLLNIQTPLGL